MGRTRKRAPDHEPFRSQEILRWAEEWRTLRAWERDLYEVQISVPGSYNHGVYGACVADGKRLRVYYSPEGIAVDLSTLLHEMAHADTPHDHVDHGPVWRATLARAVLEVTGTDLSPKFAELVGYLPNGELLRSQVDYHVDKAVREWWRRTGNDLAYDLGRGWLHRRRETNRLARSHTVRLPDEPEREWCTGGGLGKRTGGFACLANAVNTFRELRNYSYAGEPSWIDRCFAIHDRWPEYAARRAHRYAR